MSNFKKISTLSIAILGFCLNGYSQTVWAWGNNGNGQLGLGNTNDQYIPETIIDTSDFKLVTAGYLNTFAIKKDGTLWAWGDNSGGQLGLGNYTSSYNSPQQIGTDSNWL